MPLEIIEILPLPEIDSSDDVFNPEIEKSWGSCDRADLLAEISRGRIVRAVRDRGKFKGDSKGNLYSNWCKEMSLTSSKAIALISLADRADDLISSTNLPERSIANFTKKAFLETVEADSCVQQRVCEEVQRQKIGLEAVRRIKAQYTVNTSPLVEGIVRESVDEGVIKPKDIAKWVDAVEKIPEPIQPEFVKNLALAPSSETAKGLTASAKGLTKFLDAASRLNLLRDRGIDFDCCLEEANRLDTLDLAAAFLSKLCQLNEKVNKLYLLWSAIEEQADRLWTETGASTPHLRKLIDNLEILNHKRVSIPIDDDLQITIAISDLDSPIALTEEKENATIAI